MMAASTTTWYAYKDSKTGREYFHEPISGKTSWVLPTSSSIDLSETLEKNKSSSKFGTSKPNRNRQQQQQPMKVMDKQSRSWAVGIITSVIIFNTIFLLVLTSYLYTNQVPEQINITSNDGINIVQIPVKDSDEYIIQIDNDNKDVDVAKETTYKYTTQSESDGKTVIDDVQQETDTQTPEDENTTTDNMEEKHTHHETEHSIDCKSNRGDTNEDDYKAELHKAHAHEPISTDYVTTAGKSCWVPFSYMLVDKCRRQAREGFGPMANADNTLWI